MRSHNRKLLTAYRWFHKARNSKNKNCLFRSMFECKLRLELYFQQWDRAWGWKLHLNKVSRRPKNEKKGMLGNFHSLRLRSTLICRASLELRVDKNNTSLFFFVSFHSVVSFKPSVQSPMNEWRRWKNRYGLFHEILNPLRRLHGNFTKGRVSGFRCPL